MAWERPASSFLQQYQAPIPAVHLPPQPAARAPEQVQKNDLSSTISSAGELCSRAERVLEQARKLANLESSSSGSGSGVLLPCPFDRRHTMPASSLLRHSIRCSSSPFGLSEEAATLVSSLRYLRSEAQDSTSAWSFDPTGTKFFYSDAPGPVRAGAQQTGNSPSLPEFIRDLIEGEEQRKTPEFDRLLPSQCWALQEQVRAWSFLPKSYSFFVLVSALGMKLDKERIIEWMLVNSVTRHGVVLDPMLADHLFVLASLFLAAVQREALKLWSDPGNKPSSGYGALHYNCPVLIESGNWLASQLLSLFQPPAAGLFVLGLLQSSLINSARRLALEFHSGTSSEAGAGDQDLATSSEVEAAFSALKERVDLESYLRAKLYINNLTKAALVNEYDILVSNASVERQLRPGFRPTLEHDGLGWHRQNSEKTKLKSKEEMLADERDYKRRRQSYKGKKLRRTPKQVLHDIIETQMNDIVAAGGIGCFTTEPEPHEENLSSRATRENESPSTRYDHHTWESSSRSRYHHEQHHHHQTRESQSRRSEHKHRQKSHDEEEKVDDDHMNKHVGRREHSTEHVRPHESKRSSSSSHRDKREHETSRKEGHHSRR